MVVPVFITNCHVSLNPKNGPVIAQTIMISTASTKVIGRPEIRDVFFANCVNEGFELAIELSLPESNR